MAAQQLERSVLEGKERDELFAIADALGLKPTQRAKKADLVATILQATGVEGQSEGDAGEEPPKPRRTRRKAVASEDDTDELAAAAPADSPASEPEDGSEGRAASDEAPELEVRAMPDDEDGNVSPGPAAPGPAGQPARQQERARPVGGQANGQQGGPQQGGSPQPQSQQQPGGEDEAGSRRSRRRRGRDRVGMGPGYEQQAQQADQSFAGEVTPVAGLLDIRPEGFGFLRSTGYLPGADDVYVSTSQLRRFGLRAGDRIEGGSRPASSQEKFPALVRIDTVSGQTPDEARARRHFDDLTPVHPDERFNLEMADPLDPAARTGRLVDLLAPVGKGQRGLVVSPPRAGKSTVITHLAQAIGANHPDVGLLVVLVDERPEEVTAMRRSVRGEVISSTFDRPAEEHVHVVELAIEVAKRRVEAGEDVVMLLDGMTRLTRAYVQAVPPGGRTGFAGIDAAALHAPKRIFGAARNALEGGSLTILATALVDTGSALDAVILDELSATANMELRLDRRLAELRTFPAVDVTASATSHEGELRSQAELAALWQLRRMLIALDAEGPERQAYARLADELDEMPDNAALIAHLAHQHA